MTHSVFVITDRATGQHAGACSCGWRGQPFNRLAKEAARRSSRFHRTFAIARDDTGLTVQQAADGLARVGRAGRRAA